MLVEFNELLDRTELSPVATNMTVEAMPNDNLVRNRISTSVLHSHWSRNVEARLSLVERFIVLLRQLSYAIKNQLGHPKPPTRGFGTQRPILGSMLAPRWFFMA